MYTKITGVGTYLPSKVLTNFDLEKMMETSDQWITDRTGIKRRHIAADHETTSSMATLAAHQALDDAGLAPEDLDMIIVATCSPNKMFPSCACQVQEGLGIDKPIAAFDISVACAGYIYGLSIADQFIRTGSMKNVLLIGSETMSRIIDWNDRSTCVLFGDGAAATLLQADEHPGVMTTHLRAQGKYKELLSLSYRTADAKHQEACQYVRMQGHEVFRIAVRSLEKMVEETLEASKLSKQDIDWLIPHQANIRIIQATAKKLQMPMEKVVLTIQEQGNTSAASIPLALAEGVRNGQVKRGQILLFEAFGGGLAWGSALVKF